MLIYEFYNLQVFFQDCHVHGFPSSSLLIFDEETISNLNVILGEKNGCYECNNLFHGDQATVPNPPEPIFSITSNVSVSFVKLRRKFDFSVSKSQKSEESSVELKSILGWFVLGALEMNFEVLMAVKFALFTTWR